MRKHSYLTSAEGSSTVAFLTKAPLVVVSKERDNLNMRKDRLERLKQRLDELN